jgi:hypothetical protein
MRKILAIAGMALTSVLFTSSAFAQDTTPAPTPGATPAPGAPTDASTNEADKKIGIGGDLQFVLPLGDFADSSGPLIGPVLRVGYRVMPPLELTLRAGFLFGISKDRSQGGIDASSGVNIIPIHIGARYFFMEPYAGVYGAAEIGMNMISPKASVGGTSVSGLDSQTRFGANLGVGYVISKDLPIDIRAQFMLLNLIGKDNKSVGGISVDEPTFFGLGISAGYTFQF